MYLLQQRVHKMFFVVVIVELLREEKITREQRSARKRTQQYNIINAIVRIVRYIWSYIVTAEVIHLLANVSLIIWYIIIIYCVYTHRCAITARSVKHKILSRFPSGKTITNCIELTHVSFTYYYVA